MTATVVMHRPVYKRVDLAAKPARPAETPIVDLGLNAEGERIWALLKQCAQGTNGVVE